MTKHTPEVNATETETTESRRTPSKEQGMLADQTGGTSVSERERFTIEIELGGRRLRRTYTLKREGGK